MSSTPCPPGCDNPNYHLHTAPDDPAYHLMADGVVKSQATAERDSGCYICTDPEFALMGLPLCGSCSACVAEGRGKGHVPADDESCSVCGYNEREKEYPEGVFDLLGRMH